MSRTETTGRGALTAIAIFKLLKAALLAAIAVGVHRLMRGDVEATILRWGRAVRVDPDDHILQALVTRLTSLTTGQVRAISLGLILYAALFATEGVGLIMKKRWAEYMTVISTALLLPLEIRELILHPRAGRVAVLIANLVILVYLIVRLRRTRRREIVSA